MKSAKYIRTNDDIGALVLAVHFKARKLRTIAKVCGIPYCNLSYVRVKELGISALETTRTGNGFIDKRCEIYSIDGYYISRKEGKVFRTDFEIALRHTRRNSVGSKKYFYREFVGGQSNIGWRKLS